MVKAKKVSRSHVKFTEPVNLDGVRHSSYEDATDNICYQPYGLEIDMGTTEVETYVIIPWHRISSITEVVTTIENYYSLDDNKSTKN